MAAAIVYSVIFALNGLRRPSPPPKTLPKYRYVNPWARVPSIASTCEGLDIQAEVDQWIEANGSRSNRLAMEARLSLGGCVCGAQIALNGAWMLDLCGRTREDALPLGLAGVPSEDLTLDQVLAAARPRLLGCGLRGVRPPQLIPCYVCRCPEAPGETRLSDGRMQVWNVCEAMMCPRCGERDGVGLGYYRDGSKRCGWLCPRCGDFPLTQPAASRAIRRLR